MGWLLLSFCAALGAISPDGLGVDYQPRLPATATAQPSDYQRTVPTGPVTVTRRSLTLAITSHFVYLIYSTNLYLLTTAPEEITAGIESLMQPLRRLKCVTEIALTLTLSLRFIPLVLEEVQI